MTEATNIIGDAGQHDADDARSASPLTTIDLANQRDFNLVHRAIAKHWPLSEHVREQICAQLPAVVNAFRVERRSDKQFKKLKALALAVGMDMQHLGGESVTPGTSPNRQKRNPNRRQLRALGRQRAREALHQRVTALKGT
jgi:hypothetical protein